MMKISVCCYGAERERERERARAGDTVTLLRILGKMVHNVDHPCPVSCVDKQVPNAGLSRKVKRFTLGGLEVSHPHRNRRTQNRTSCRTH